MYYDTNTKSHDDKNTFTFVIRSSNKEFSTDNTNNCTIRLNGLPNKYKYFDCEVSALHVSTNAYNFNTSTFELRVDDSMEIINGRDTTCNMLRSVAFASFNNTYPQGPYTFRTDNFNNRTVRFQLYDDYNNLLQYSSTNNLINFTASFTYIGATTSTLLISSIYSPTAQLQVGQVINNYVTGVIGTITAQTGVYTYTILTLQTSSIGTSAMFTTNSTVNYNKPWILILNMVGIE